MKQVVEGRDAFDLGDFVLAQFHLLEIDQAIQFVDLGDVVLLQLEFLQQLALVDVVNLSDFVVGHVNGSEGVEMLEACH